MKESKEFRELAQYIEDSGGIVARLEE